MTHARSCGLGREPAHDMTSPERLPGELDWARRGTSYFARILNGLRDDGFINPRSFPGYRVVTSSLISDTKPGFSVRP